MKTICNLALLLLGVLTIGCGIGTQSDTQVIVVGPPEAGKQPYLSLQVNEPNAAAIPDLHLRTSGSTTNGNENSAEDVEVASSNVVNPYMNLDVYEPEKGNIPAIELRSGKEIKKKEQVGNGKKVRIHIRMYACFPWAVHFERGSDVVKSNQFHHIAVVADALRTIPEARVVLVGNTDSIGSGGFNTNLGFDRAVNVSRYLIHYGVLPSQIEVCSAGEDNPVCDNRYRKCQNLNRRVDMVVLVPVSCVNSFQKIIVAHPEIQIYDISSGSCRQMIKY